MNTSYYPEQDGPGCQLGRAGTWIAPILTDPKTPSPLRWAIADWRQDALAAMGLKQEWWTAPVERQRSF